MNKVSSPITPAQKPKRTKPDIEGYRDLTHALQLARESITAAEAFGQLILKGADILIADAHDKMTAHTARTDLRPRVRFLRVSASKFSVTFNDSIYYYYHNGDDGADELTWAFLAPVGVSGATEHGPFATKHDALAAIFMDFCNPAEVPTPEHTNEPEGN